MEIVKWMVLVPRYHAWNWILQCPKSLSRYHVRYRRFMTVWFEMLFGFVKHNFLGKSLGLRLEYWLSSFQYFNISRPYKKLRKPYLSSWKLSHIGNKVSFSLLDFGWIHFEYFISVLVWSERKVFKRSSSTLI